MLTYVRKAFTTFATIIKRLTEMLNLSYRSILAMAIPLMGSTFIQSIVLITDSAFLSRYSTEAFDAVGNGGLIYITLFMMLVGMSDGSQILLARRIGQNKLKMIPRTFGTSLLINFVLVILLFLLLNLLAPSLIMSYAKHADIALGQIEYIHLRSFGLFFSCFALCINAFFMATGKTMVVFFSALLTASSNIVLDYILIFGKTSLPIEGVQGAALASTLADGIGLIFLIIVFIKSKSQKKYNILKNLSIGLNSFKELFKLGTPIMLQGLVALFTWTVFFIWIEQIGKTELTVSQNIRSLYFLAFVPVWGFGATTKTYISQYVGNRDYASVKVIIRKVQILTVLFLFVFFHGALLYPEKMIALVNPNIEFIPESASILRFITGSIFIFGIGSTYFQAISGTGNTRFTLYVELISVSVYLISAYLLIKVFETSIFWIWSVEYIYFIFMGALSFFYLRFFNWQKKQI